MTTEELSTLLLERIKEEEDRFNYSWNKNDAAGTFQEHLNDMTNVELLNMLTDSVISSRSYS